NIGRAHQPVRARLQPCLSQPGGQVGAARGVFQQVEALDGGEDVDSCGQREVRFEGVVLVVEAAGLGELADAMGGGDAADAAGVDLEVSHAAVQHQVFGGAVGAGDLVLHGGVTYLQIDAGRIG